MNLAAEFLANPFADQFAKVDAAVQAQQALETNLVQQFLHNVPTLKTTLPEEAASIDKITATGLRKDAELFKAAKDLVVPVQHVIKVEGEP